MTRLPVGIRQRLRRSVSLARAAVRVGLSTIGGRIREARLPQDFAPQASDEFVAAAYFSSEMDSVYQLEQWVWPFEQLAKRLTSDGYSTAPVGIFVRSAAVAEHMRTVTDLPVRFSRLSKGLDSFMSAPSLRLVFYVNQATGNFQSLQFPDPAHVHLSHGESEKISMISNQLKAYDYVFTAGPAARERIGRTLIGLPDERMLDVGRPQLDRPWELPQGWREFAATAPNGPTIFYAPTWEGDSPAMSYGTIADNGEFFVREMLGAGYRVIFRPHPRTGSLNGRFKSALSTVQSIIDDDPKGFMDTTRGVSWQLDAADLCLAEMSSVAFDWLSARKPLVMIAPHSPGAEVLAGGLLDRCPAVAPGEESKLMELFESAAGSIGSAAVLSRDYLGDTEPGDQIERYVAAALHVVTARDQEIVDRAAV